MLTHNLLIQRPTASQFVLLLLYCYYSYCVISVLGVVHMIQAEIVPSSNTASVHHRPIVANRIEEHSSVRNGNALGFISKTSSSNNRNKILNNILKVNSVCVHSQCSKYKFRKLIEKIDDFEDLKLGVPVHIAFKARQRKRFVLQLNASTPLNITFSQNVTRKIFYNETVNLSSSFKWDPRVLQLPCALPGQYDIFIQARHGSFKIEAHAVQAELPNWALFNQSHQVSIRTRNQLRKKRMQVRWTKSKYDFHVMHYCLVISLKRSHDDFCQAMFEHYSSIKRRSNKCCYFMDYIWFQPLKKVKEIVPRITNVICTGTRTNQILHGLSKDQTYYLDVFGIHTKRNNMSIHLASKVVTFNSTHPTPLKQNVFTVEKISGLDRKVFSFKIPPLKQHHQHFAQQHLRYLVLPCNGSTIDVQFTIPFNETFQQRIERNIYVPTYYRLTPVHTGQRYLIRFKPNNADEKLRFQKIGLAVTTANKFEHFAELPQNITVYEVGRHCTSPSLASATIAWHNSPDERNLSYCIIVFNLPHFAIDYTNYCMDFGKHVTRHPHFYSINCKEKQRNPAPFESERIMNLIPGELYLIFVTANLSNGQPIPYQALKIQMHTLRCDE